MFDWMLPIKWEQVFVLTSEFLISSYKEFRSPSFLIVATLTNKSTQMIEMPLLAEQTNLKKKFWLHAPNIVISSLCSKAVYK